jgi:membrane fusion protein (multidrug efflux system)
MRQRNYVVLLLTLLFLMSCHKKGAAPAAEMIPEVTAIRVEAKDVPIIKEFVGQVAGIRDIQVRARVGGILMKRYYTEGAYVKEGQPLFLIDPEPFKVQLSQAASVVRIEEARHENARRALDRILPLYKENAVSQKDRDDAIAEFQGSKSSLETARARYQNSKIDLGYTTVTAPISGFTSKETVSEGSLIVSNSDKSLLTVISQIDPAYVNFTYSENEMLELRKGQAAGTLGGSLDKLKVKIKLGDGSFFPGEGKLNFNDILVDPTTGTIRARATFTNTENALKAGQFVRVYVEGFQLNKSILIPMKAVITTQKGPIAFIVDKQSTAQQVSLELGQEIGNNVVVNKGLRSGDYLIVEGASKVRAGQKVKIMTERAMAQASSF